MNPIKHPGLYAQGIGVVSIFEAILGWRGHALSDWSRELRNRRRFEEGQWREVYELNVLSNKHLDLTVGDINVRQLLVSYGQEIMIEKLNPNLEIVRVSKGARSLVRRELSKLGLIIANESFGSVFAGNMNQVRRSILGERITWMEADHIKELWSDHLW
jgi:hypothetical protein